MAKFEGKQCDECGAVHSAEKMTVRTTRYQGPHVEGEILADLCPQCVGEDPYLSQAREEGSLRPLRRRSKQTQQESPAPAESSAEPARQ